MPVLVMHKNRLIKDAKELTEIAAMEAAERDGAQ